MAKVWLDLETFSPVDIRDGVYAYAEKSRILLFSWAIDDEPAQCSEMLPVEVWQTVGDQDTEVWAHNAMFDRTILNYNKYIINLDKWRDTSIQARAHGLPAGLDALAKLYALKDGKIEDGRRLINLFCKPAKDGRVNNKQTHPEDWKKFKEYAVRDVEVMRELHNRMPKTNYPYNGHELGLWHLDQKINDRGFNVDTKLVDSVLTALAQETERLDSETANLTEGGLNNTRRRDATIDYVLEKYGILVKDLTKSSVAKLIDDEETPAEMRELLLLRQQASTASTAKYNTLKKMMNSDGRLRGSIQFCGAARTGRASGRGFQPQNLPSRGLLKSQDIDDGIKFLKMGMADLSPFPVMKLASSAIRRVLVPSNGNHLITCDLSNIEGRIAAWLAGEQWKLRAFRDFDAGVGKDLYNLAYAKAFNVDVDSVTDEQRSIGKVLELACFHPNTSVLTSNGIKRIMEVSTDDKLWDGIEWVKHKGVIVRGVRKVVHVGDTGITPDHLILTGKTWKPVQNIVSDASILYQALETGSNGLQLLNTHTQLQVKLRIGLKRAAIVAKNLLCCFKTYAQGKQHNVGIARMPKEDSIGKNYTDTRTSYRTNTNVLDYSLGYQPLSLDATLRTIGNGTVTEAGASRFVLNGARINVSFSSILSRFRIGVSRIWKWIERTTTKATSRETYGSYLKEITTQTDELLKRYNQESMSLSVVYDIAHVGARNRFTIITSEGALIVHNCGYSGGVGAFNVMALGYGFDLEKLADDIYDTLPKNIILDSQVYLDFLYKNNGERYQLSDKAFLTVDTLKRMWRESNPEIALFWEKINTAVKKAIETKEPQPLGLLTVRCSKMWLSIELPSGRRLFYALPELIDDKIYYHGIGQYSRKWERIGTYHGKLFENICQATARDILYYCMPQVERAGMKIVLHVHDELITDSPKDIKPKRLSEIMTAGFDWSKGLPLAAKAKSMMAYQK